MNNNTDDRDAGLPPVGSPEELEEALKWLEDLTARQGKAADLPNPVPPTSIDSPFHGLIESEEGDLPDWLRELPQPQEAESFDDAEPESRLDWLAKMAQRESIEELPTLEWRRLPEPLQSSLVAEDSALMQEMRVEETLAAADDQLTIDQQVDTAAEETVSQAESTAPEPPEPADAQQAVEDTTLAVEFEALAPPAEDVPPITTLADEDLVESITLNPDEELPPLDDLDAAMAWIEELAASQQAPIEDIPSVGDRALASKLMMEAGLPPLVLPLDELGSDSALLESLTPTHPFIEEEDFADTVVLVETMAADQGIVMEMPEETPLLAEDVAAAEDQASIDERGMDAGLPAAGEDFSVAAPADELSFDEAMAFLDELAVVKLHEGGEVEIEPLASEPSAVLTGVAVVEVIDEFSTAEEEGLASADAPWADSAIIPPAEDEAAGEDEWIASVVEDTTVPETVEEAALNSQTMDAPELETTLSALDEWALPPGQTLSGIAAALATARVAPTRDLSSALTWLEARLEAAPAAPAHDLDEADLIARMPEDPDEVLAWLERIAGEEPDVTTTGGQTQQTGLAPAALSSVQAEVEIGETDLFEMPDDPDEAMIWLESLARGDRPPAAQSSTEPAVAEMVEPPSSTPESVGAVESVSLSPQAVAAVEPEPIPTPDSLPATASGEQEAPAKPTTRRRRRRATERQPAPTDLQLMPDDQPALEQPPLEQTAEEQPPQAPVAEEQPPQEIPAEEPPPAKKAAASWIDLLKPLE